MLDITTVFENRNMTLSESTPNSEVERHPLILCSVLCLLLVFELQTVCLDKALDMAPVLCC